MIEMTTVLNSTNYCYHSSYKGVWVRKTQKSVCEKLNLPQNPIEYRLNLLNWIIGRLWECRQLFFSLSVTDNFNPRFLTFYRDQNQKQDPNSTTLSLHPASTPQKWLPNFRKLTELGPCSSHTQYGTSSPRAKISPTRPRTSVLGLLPVNPPN